MRALLIDPFAETIEEVDIDNTLASYYETLRCELVEFVTVGTNKGQPVMYIVDEEGRLKENQRCFFSAGHLIAGRALLVGTLCGEEIATDMAVEVLQHFVQFLPEDFDYTINL